MKKWIILTVISVVLLVTSNLIARSDIENFPNYGGVFKMIASTGFIMTALAAGARNSRYGKAILVGLFFSWWGDAFLIASSSTFFQLGLVSFLIGHIAYCVAFGVHGVARSGIIRGVLIAPHPRLFLVDTP